MIERILLEFAEKMQALTESSLTRIMNDPLGHKLAQYLHTSNGIPDQVEVKEVPLDYMKNTAWTSGTEYVIFKGKKGWVLREPNSAVPVIVMNDAPEVRKEIKALPNGEKWEDAIEPIAAYSINKPLTRPEVMARASRQRAGKHPQLSISHKLLTPAIVTSVIHGAKIDLKRWNQQRKRPWNPETLKAWMVWLNGLESALNEGENEIMHDIDWPENTPEEDQFAEAEDFWNAMVYDAVRNTDVWTAAEKADREEISKKYPDQSGALARGINVPRVGSHTTALIKNTVFLQTVKRNIIDNIVDFISSNDLV